MIDVRELKAGDLIRRDEANVYGFHFTKGNVYEVFENNEGVYIREDDGTIYDESRLKANHQRWSHVVNEKRVGLVTIENITGYSSFGTGHSYTVTVETDIEGLEAIKELERKSEEQSKLRRVDADIAELEKRLERLKEERKTLI